MFYFFIRRFIDTRRFTYARILVLVLLLDSAAFTFSSILLILNNRFNQISCLASILICDLLYFAAKLFIYLFFIERVHAVHDGTKAKLQSPLFRLNMLLLLPFFAILVLMIMFRIHEIHPETGECTIGLQHIATIPLVVYDAFFNTYLTALFVYPLYVNTGRLSVNSKLRNIAQRTFIGSTVALVVTVANILILIAQNGRELAFLCLCSCTTDIFINAMTTYLCTRGDNLDGEKSSHGNSVHYTSAAHPSRHTRLMSVSSTQTLNTATKANLPEKP